MKRTLQVLIVIVFGMIPFLVHSQDNTSPRFKSHFNFQLNGGVTQYFGDLNKDDLFNRKLNAGFGGILGYQISPVLGVRSQFLYGKLSGEHADKLQKMNTDLWDLGLNLTLNINELFSPYNPERIVNVYLFGGAGLTSFTTSISDYNTDVEIGKSDGRQNELFIPMGLGLAFRVTEKLDINLEYGDHLTMKDNTLDLYEGGSKRDQYSFASLGLSLKFGGVKDADDDGVKDKDDACPDKAGKVELAGCPDRDNDGITDDMDDCPDVAGKIEFKGCPDSDNDGIPDKDDACPNAAGKRDLKGCPDKDMDGVADKDDKCPDMAGKKEFGGCPDRDGDGIPDKDDLCPDQAGLTTLTGCPDKDKDGVADNVDKCPEVAGPVTNFGCPETEKALVSEVVYFGTDEAIVLAAYNQTLHKVVETMKDNPGIRVVVAGHTDSRESKEYNMKLSENRAEYVISFLTSKGIEASRIIKEFYGESMPVADNSTEEGMAMNRRVELKSIK